MVTHSVLFSAQYSSIRNFLGFNDFYNMIFNPKEELLPPAAVRAPSSNHVPYYAPNQTERSNILPQQTAQQVPPDQDNKIQQLEVVCYAHV